MKEGDQPHVIPEYTGTGVGGPKTTFTLADRFLPLQNESIELDDLCAV